MEVSAFVKNYLREYQPYKKYWCYEDGCVLKGAADLSMVCLSAISPLMN